MIRWRTRSVALAATPAVRIPAEGSQPSVTENTMMNMIPSQKPGIETPKNDPTVAR